MAATPEPLPPPPSCTCSCTCLCCGPSSSPSATWRRSLKRKLDQIQQLQQQDSGDARGGDVAGDGVSARVEIENEVVVLRETLNRQQQSIQDLYMELEEERSASATAASEVMSMTLRLQREKAEAQMEFRQFKRFAEEKMAHDQEEILVLEDLLFKRDQAVQSLNCEIQACKHRMMSYGFSPSEPQTPDTANATTAAAMAAAAFDYPPLRCKIAPNNDVDDELEKYAFGETPKEQIQNLEQRIYQMERMPSSVHDKGVVAFSPRKPFHVRRLSMDSFGSFNDRVYTVDKVHCGPESYMSTPREFGGKGAEVNGEEEEEIKRLHARLQALEADRETMRQTIMSMGTDKAQLVLLKEIAQQLCKEVTPQQQVVQQKKIVKKTSFIRSFSIMTAVKWIMSFVFWKKKSLRTKYAFGITSNNAGLLLLIDKSPRMRQRRCLTRTLR